MKTGGVLNATMAPSSSVSLEGLHIDDQLEQVSILEDLPYDIRRLVYLECISSFVLEAQAIHLPKSERERLPFHEGWRNVIDWQHKADYMSLICTSKWLKLEVEHLMWESTILYLSNVNLIHQGLCFVPSIWARIRCVFIDGSLRKTACHLISTTDMF